MYAALAWQPRTPDGRVENPLSQPRVHGSLRVTGGRKEPVRGPKALPVALQFFQQYRGKQRVTVFAVMESFP